MCKAVRCRSTAGLKLMFMVLGLLQTGLSATILHADIPTAEQDCQNRRSATCENHGLKYQLDGPCPSRDKTIKPFEAIDCSLPAIKARLSKSNAEAKTGSHSPITPAPNSTTRPEPLLTLVQALTLLFAMAMVVVLFRWQRNRGNSTGVILVRWAIKGIAGFLAGLAMALASFGYVMRHYHNADTAGPALIGFGAGFIAFFLTYAIVAFGVGLLLKHTSLKLKK